MIEELKGEERRRKEDEEEKGDKQELPLCSMQ